MSDQQETRRNFVKSAGLAAAAWTIVKPGSVYGAPQNSKFKLGILGVGRRATNVGGYFAKSDQVELAAIADIYDSQIQAAQEHLPVQDAHVYKSAKAMLDSEIDAIYIATPPYLHPEQFEMAVASGKHILMEKPVAATRPAAAACSPPPESEARADGDRSTFSSARARTTGGVRTHARRRDRRHPHGTLGLDRRRPAAPQRAPAPEEEKILNWLFYKERSGDILVEQNCHNIDVVNWFTGDHPVSVTGYGARAIRNDIGDIMDSLSVTFKFADGRVYSHSANQFDNGGYRDVGEYFFGTKGVATTSRGGYTLQVAGKEPYQKKTNYNINQDVVDHFIAGVQGKIPAENAAVFAAESTLTAIMARIAIDEGREMTFEEVFKM